MLSVRSIATLLLAAGVAGAAHAQDLQDGQAVLSVDGADLAHLPLAIDANGNDQDPVVYDLGVPEVRMIVADASQGAQRSYKYPLFCFDFGSGQGAAATLSVRDANGHTVVSDVGVPDQLEYLLTASSEDVPTALLTPASDDVQCFYKGSSSGEFGLFGVSEPSVAEGMLFSDAFQATANLDLSIDAKESANPGEAVTIIMTITNSGDLGLDRIAFQELYPWLENFYDASLTSGTFNCSADGGAVCPSGGSSENGDSLRFGDLAIPPDGELVFSISRFVRNDAEPGKSINLYAGAVGVSATSVASASAEHIINVIGEGESLTAPDVSMTAGEATTLTVKAVDGSGLGVPGVDVTVADDADLSITAVDGTTTDESGEVDFEISQTEAAMYAPEFAATDLNPATPSVDVAPAGADSMTATVVSQDDPVADGVESGDFEVEVRDEHTNVVPGVTVEVSDDDGLDFGSVTESQTNSQGVAAFSASTINSGTYTVEFAIAGVDTASASVSFVAGPAEKLAFLPDYQPVDTPVDEPLPDLKVEVLDDNDNRVTDHSGSVNLLVTEPVFDAITSVSADQGVATFSGVTFSDAGQDYILQATASGLSSDDSVPFDVLAPDELGVGLVGFQSSYEKGDSETGSEVVEFTYAEGAGDIGQIFNVFRVIDNDTGEEIDAATYDELFVDVSYGPAGSEDYIRGLSGPDNAVPPDTRTVEVYFTLETTAPEGDYQLTLTSYDVTGVASGDVSLDDANAGEYDILATAATDVIVDGGP